jgi:hypothetical protein
LSISFSVVFLLPTRSPSTPEIKMNTIIEIKSVKELKLDLQKQIRFAKRNCLLNDRTISTVQEFVNFLGIYEPFEIIDLKIQLLKNEDYTADIHNCLSMVSQFCSEQNGDSKALRFFEVLMADSSS